MTDPSDDEFFYDVMKDLAEEVEELGALGTGESVASAVREQLDPGVFDNSLGAVVRALELFSKAMGYLYDGRSPAIDSEETSCRLLEAGLVNIVCGFLPDPKTLERSKQGLWELELVVNGFQEFVKFLRKVIGRKELEASCDGDLLGKLYLISDLAADRVTASGSTLPAHQVLVDELYFLAWETHNNIPTRGHKAHITALLDYLRWHIQGRKDISCPVAKPWVESSTVQSIQGLQDDLSRLLPADFSATCAGCSATDASFPCVECQFTGGHQLSTVYCNQLCLEAHSAAHAVPCKETRDLIRTAALFQLVFEKFLRFTKTKIGFTVSKEDGVVRKVDTPHASPPMDFDKEEVQAALHNLCCNAPQYEAKMLLEKFIQPFCNSIEFFEFVPKNAETTVFYGPLTNMSPHHMVSQLTTASGLKFAFDPTAAQFGWKENLAPWDIYEHRRIDFTVPVETAGSRSVSGPSTLMNTEALHQVTVGDWREYCVAQEMKDMTVRFLGKGGPSGVLALPESEFVKRLQELERHLAKSVADSAELEEIYKPGV